ncbi:MAG: antitoxin [Planctomycetota bacterium]|nr:antitoxin [Planctomycetota bacterium]MDA1143232.1 antitoxin [Planctomycetota bacterium]
MKTTLELPDDLLIEAKAVAAKRRTTLKAMVEHALRREVASESQVVDAACAYEKDEYGIPSLKKRAGVKVTSETIYQLMDDEGI